MDVRQRRQRTNTLNVIKGALDSARQALMDGDFDAHDSNMATARSFLESYDKFPALTPDPVDATPADAPIESAPAPIDAPADAVEKPADKPVKRS